jgi:hypothetical protein
VVLFVLATVFLKYFYWIVSIHIADKMVYQLREGDHKGWSSTMQR